MRKGRGEVVARQGQRASITSPMDGSILRVEGIGVKTLSTVIRNMGSTYLVSSWLSSSLLRGLHWRET